MFLTMCRILTVTFGVATIYIVYLLGKKIKNEETGLIASLFLTFMYLHIQESRYLRYTVVMVFCIALTFLFILNMLFRGQLKYYILSGFFIGLGGAIKYMSVVTMDRKRT